MSPAALVWCAVLCGASPRAAVVDGTASDAAYEDVSRTVTQSVADALSGAGFASFRVDENELPEGGCQSGPCLAEVASRSHADVLVLVSVNETEHGLQVAVVGMRGTTGEPLGVARFTMKDAAGTLPKIMKKLVQKLWQAITAPDADKRKKQHQRRSSPAKKRSQRAPCCRLKHALNGLGRPRYS